MKRRRTKDYVKLLETLIKEANIGLTLKPIQVMIDFEIAAKKAFKKSITLRWKVFKFNKNHSVCVL